MGLKVRSYVAFLCAIALTSAAESVAEACTADAQCKGGRVCREGECRADPGCTKDTECSGALVCHERACTKECTKDTECSNDEVCNGGYCGKDVPVSPPPDPAAPLPPAAEAAPPPTGLGSGPAEGPPPEMAAQPPPDAPPPPSGPESKVLIHPAGGAAAVVPAERPDHVVAGLGILGIGLGVYLLALPITAAASDGRATELAAIPLAGPFAILAVHEGRLTTGGTVFYIADGLIQGLFIGLGTLVLIAGVAEKKESATVLPWLDPERGVAGVRAQGVTF